MDPNLAEVLWQRRTGGNDNSDGGVNVSALPKGEKLILTSGVPTEIIATVTSSTSGHIRTSIWAE